MELSLIIACRNEIDNLPNLLVSIENQIYKPDEVIFVDDNSTDETYDFLNYFSKKHNYIKIIKNNGKGKKSALIEGAKIGISKYLMFTDADCYLNKNHCKLALEYIKENKSDMLLGAVDIIDEKGVFNIIEKIEFASLQAVTAYTALINNPTMCNGANLIIKRDIYLKYISEINKNIASGDDMFMLHALKKNKAKINYLFNKDYIVKTKGTNNFHKFLLQRTRWASKSVNYKDIFTIFIAILVVIINIGILISLFYSYIPFLIIFIIENIIILPYLIKYKYYRILKYYPILFPIMSLLYPIYVIIILLSLISYNKTNPHWK